MPAYEIPTSATDQRFSIPLNGVIYQLTCKWCAPASAWTLDIATDGGEALVSGIPIVTGVDLLEQHRHIGIAGRLVAQTDGDTFAPPTQTNLGIAGRLYFLPDEAATSTTAGAVFETPVTPGFNALGTLAALVPDAGAVIVGTGSTWVTETGATARTTLGVQALNDNLTALAGLAGAADKAPYFTGSGAVALATLTSSGRALAALTGATDKVPYFTGAGAASTADFTAAGRALSGAADAAAQRVAIGLVVGTDVQAHNAELDAVAAISSTGFVQRTGALTWSTATPPGALLGILQDQKSSGTHGGTFTTGAWRTRDLNTEVYDRNSILSISSNQFTISSAGVYEISWRAPSFYVNGNQSMLYNITDATLVAYGSTINSNVIANFDSVGIALVTITGAKTFEIQHKCANTYATYGFGEGAGMATEVYTSVTIRKG
jgi:hypothetical protein